MKKIQFINKKNCITIFLCLSLISNLLIGCTNDENKTSKTENQPNEFGQNNTALIREDADYTSLEENSSKWDFSKMGIKTYSFDSEKLEEYLNLDCRSRTPEAFNQLFEPIAMNDATTKYGLATSYTYSGGEIAVFDNDDGMCVEFKLPLDDYNDNRLDYSFLLREDVGNVKDFTDVFGTRMTNLEINNQLYLTNNLIGKTYEQIVDFLGSTGSLYMLELDNDNNVGSYSLEYCLIDYEKNTYMLATNDFSRAPAYLIINFDRATNLTNDYSFYVQSIGRYSEKNIHRECKLYSDDNLSNKIKE